jgi:hypothetical protein
MIVAIAISAADATSKMKFLAVTPSVLGAVLPWRLRRDQISEDQRESLGFSVAYWREAEV